MGGPKWWGPVGSGGNGCGSIQGSLNSCESKLRSCENRSRPCGKDYRTESALSSCQDSLRRCEMTGRTSRGFDIFGDDTPALAEAKRRCEMNKNALREDCGEEMANLSSKLKQAQDCFVSEKNPTDRLKCLTAAVAPQGYVEPVVERPIPLSIAPSVVAENWTPFLGKAMKKEIQKACREKGASKLQACVDGVVAKMIESVKAVCIRSAAEDQMSVDDCGKKLLKAPWSDVQTLPTHISDAIVKEHLLKATDGSMHQRMTTFIEWEAKSHLR